MRLKPIIALLILALPVSAHALEVKEVKSPGGLTAWLAEDHTAPVLTVKLAFRDSGSASDPKGKEGRALLASNLLLEGAGDMSANDYHTALEEQAIDIDTGLDEDIMSVSMQTLSTYRDRAFDLLGLALARPAFRNEDINRLRAQALSNLRQFEQNPGYIANMTLGRAVFGDHPYGQPKIGTPKSLKAVTRGDLQAYAKDRLAKNQMVIAVAGDITPEELAPLLDRAFTGLPDRAATETITDSQGIKAAKTEIVNKDIPQSVVMFALPGVARSSPDFFPAYVMAYLLGGDGLTSRLGVELREKRGLAYSAGAQLDPMIHGALLKGSFATRNEAAKEAVTVMRDLIRTTREQGFDDKTIADGKRYLTGAFPLQLDSNSEVANYLIVMQLFDLGRDYIDTRNQRINAVTDDEVNAIAKRLLDPEKLVTVVVGSPKDMTP